MKAITRTLNAPIVVRNVSNNILRGIPTPLHTSKVRKYIEAQGTDPYVVATDTTYD